jgi:cytochrome d ubiquinol oxidase subunit II
VRFDGGRVGERLLEWPAVVAVAASALAGMSTLELARRSRFESARYGASAAVGSVVVGWALAQRPELLPGLPVAEAAAGRPTLLATVVGVAVGAAILFPSLAVLFGLVLRGRFDSEAEAAEDVREPGTSRRRRAVTLPLALGAGAAGLSLTLVFDGGPLLAVGILALLAFVAFASVALVSAAAGRDASDEGA